MKKQNIQQNPQNTKEQQLFLKTRNGNIRSNGKQITPRAEEGYCNEATQSGPLTHKTTKLRMQQNIRRKTKKGLDKRGNKRSGMVLYVLQTTFYRKLLENVWNTETTQPRKQNVHGRQEANEPEKLYYEAQ